MGQFFDRVVGDTCMPKTPDPIDFKLLGKPFVQSYVMTVKVGVMVGY